MRAVVCESVKSSMKWILPALLLGTAPVRSGPTELTVLHVNDLHGHGMPREYLGTDLPPTFLHRDNGGLFAVGTRVRQLREELFARDPAAKAEFERSGEDGILLLEAGDTWSGTLDDAATRGQNVVDVLASPSLDVDASCPGNHAWDFGQKRWEELTRRLGAHHPQVCANLGRTGGKPIPFLKPWVIVPVQGVRVGVVGLLTPNALSESLPENTRGLEVRDVMDSLTRALDEMRALPEGERPDLTIALSHVGFDRPLAHEGMRTAGVQALAAMDDTPEGEDRAPGRNVDLVVDGHSHLDLEQRVDADTWLVQADHYALKLGEVRIPWDPEKRRMAGPPRFVRHSLFADTLPADPRMLAELKDRVARAREKNDEPLVSAEADLAVPCVPRAERQRLDSPSGELLMRALLEAAAGRGGKRPEVALINQSGVREGIYASRNGMITAGTVHAVCPFANAVEVCEITARDLVVLLGHVGIQQSTRMSWAGLEVSALQEGRSESATCNRKLTAVCLTEADGSRVNLMEPALARRKLRVVAPSFLMSRELAPYALPGTRKKTGATDSQLLREYLEAMEKKDGKITKAGVARAVGAPTRLVTE